MKIHQDLLVLRSQERVITSQILEKLQTMEDSKSYLTLGYSSLFDYLVRGLGYSEATAYQRQACVRLSREVPEIKEKIDHGLLSLSTVTVAYKHIKNKSHKEKLETLKSIECKSTREVKAYFAEPAKTIKIKQTEYKNKVHIRLELNHEQFEKLQKLKKLKSHKFNVEELLLHLIEKELKTYENMEFKRSQSKNLRFIPKRLRNRVLMDANYKCEYRGCEESHYLQIDHKLPVRLGGQPLRENLQVLCAAHNRMKG